MSRAHDYLDRLRTGVDLDGRRFHWQHVLGALSAVCAQRCNESEGVLRNLAAFEGSFLLEEEPGLPHAMSPEDLLRSMAVQTLGEWDRAQHRDVIARASEVAESEYVTAVARRYLVE